MVLVFESVGFYFKYQGVYNNGWLYNILTILQIPLWILLISNQIADKVLKRIIHILLLLFIGGGILNVLVFQGIWHFNNYTLISGSAIIVVSSCFFFFQLITENKDVNPINLPVFWFCSGALFYFAGTFFYFSLYNRIMEYQKLNGTRIFSLIILNISNILYISIIIGILILRKPKWRHQSL